MKVIPARIHVLLAREAKMGVVIRRGPSKAVCTLLWNLRTDEFTLGQWFRGRIYERRCDLSPDGKHMIYFALNGQWESSTQGSWTAISRVPYLKAVRLYPKGDTWGGGGVFLGNETFWVDGGCVDDEEAIQAKELWSDPLFQLEPFPGGKCIYYHRLLRDGWKFVEHVEVNEKPTVDVFARKLSSGWTLRKIAGHARDVEKHELCHPESNERQVLPDWEWADYESRRLVWAANGSIFAGRIMKEGLTNITELHNFSDMTFEKIKAPY